MKKPFEKYPLFITLYAPLFINGGQTLLNVAKVTRHKDVKHVFLWQTRHNNYVYVYILDDKWTAFGTMECNESFFCEFQLICRRQ